MPSPHNALTSRAFRFSNGSIRNVSAACELSVLTPLRFDRSYIDRSDDKPRYTRFLQRTLSIIGSARRSGIVRARQGRLVS